MQTDNTLILILKEFSVLKDNKLSKAKLLAKPKEALAPKTPLIFNRCVLTQYKDTIQLYQKKQAKKLKLIDTKSPNFQNDYREQQAYKAYITTIC